MKSIVRFTDNDNINTPTHTHTHECYVKMHPLEETSNELGDIKKKKELCWVLPWS